MLQSQLAEQKVLNTELQRAINAEKEEKEKAKNEDKEEIKEPVVSFLAFTFSLTIDNNSLLSLSITKDITNIYH